MLSKENQIDFCRRRCTEDGIFRASLYLATVRLAISIPWLLSNSTILSSDKIFDAGSSFISDFILNLTASAEKASPPPADAIEDVKKFLVSILSN